jgi:hypothetical protein
MGTVGEADDPPGGAFSLFATSDGLLYLVDRLGQGLAGQAVAGRGAG